MKTQLKTVNFYIAKYYNWLFPSIFILSFLLYFGSIQHEFVLDDDLVCAKNSFVQSGIKGIPDCFTHSWYYGFSGTKDRYYRPLMLTSLAIDRAIFNNNPSGYHAVNVLLYALFNVLLFYFLCLIFGKDHWLKAIIITCLFVIHPLHIEVVANIKSRDELLALGGLLGMLIMLLQFIRKNNGLYLFASVLFYGLAILSKESAYSFIGLVPLVIYFFGNSKTRQIVLISSIYLGLAVVMLYTRSLFIDSSPIPFGIIDNSLIAIENPVDRFATAIGMIGHYFYLLLFPFQLSFDYSYNQFPSISWYHWKFLGTLAMLIIIAWYVFKQIKSKDIIVFGILFFGICFVITSNIFFLTGSSFAERFLFIPSLGFCIAIGHMLYLLIINRDTAQKSAGILILIVLVISYSAKIVSRVPVWKNDQTLFETGIKTAPQSARTQSFYGKSLYDRAVVLSDQTLKSKYLESAIDYFKKSINIYPGFTESYQHLAAAYEQNQQFKLAEETYKLGFKTNSEYYPALVNLGVLYLKQERIVEAIQVLEKAYAINPDNLVINKNLGIAYQKNLAFDKAISKFQFILEKEYTIPNLGSLVELYRSKGDIQTAIEYDQQIKKLMQLEK